MLQLSEEAQRAGEGLGKLNYMYTVCLDKNEELKTKANTLQSQVPLYMCLAHHCICPVQELQSKT